MGTTSNELKNVTGITTVQTDEGSRTLNNNITSVNTSTSAVKHKDSISLPARNITEGLNQIGQLADNIGTVNIIIHTGSGGQDSNTNVSSGTTLQKIVETDIQRVTNITETKETHYVHSSKLMCIKIHNVVER